MSKITIKKAKIKTDADIRTLEVTFNRQEADKTETTCNESYEAQVHDDLKKAFSNLDVHFGLLTETIETADIDNINNPDPVLTENIHVSSFSFGGKDDQPGITISGHKKLKSGKALIMNSPFTLLQESEETGYRFLDELNKSLDSAKEEIIKYMDGKHAPDPQLSLDLPEQGATSAQIASPENVLTEIIDRVNGGIPGATAEKVKGKKKVPQTAAAKNGELVEE